jgi:DNA-binding IclR family transcriptional regulator
MREPATEREEIVPGVACVAVPVRGIGGEIVAAPAAITTPAERPPRLTEGLRRASRASGASLRRA